MMTVTSFLAGVVAVFKGISALKDLLDQFYIQWIQYDIDKLEDSAHAKKEEYEAINRAYKLSTSDVDRRALLRSLSKLR